MYVSASQGMSLDSKIDKLGKLIKAWSEWLYLVRDFLCSQADRGVNLSSRGNVGCSTRLAALGLVIRWQASHLIGYTHAIGGCFGPLVVNVHLYHTFSEIGFKAFMLHVYSSPQPHTCYVSTECNQQMDARCDSPQLGLFLKPLCPSLPPTAEPETTP